MVVTFAFNKFGQAWPGTTSTIRTNKASRIVSCTLMRKMKLARKGWDYGVTRIPFLPGNSGMGIDSALRILIHDSAFGFRLALRDSNGYLEATALRLERSATQTFFFNRLNPELQSQIFSSRVAQIRPQFLFIAVFQHIEIKRQSPCKMLNVISVALCIPFDLRKCEVVRVESKQAKVIEGFRKHLG